MLLSSLLTQTDSSGRIDGNVATGHDDSTHGLASVLFLTVWLLYI